VTPCLRSCSSVSTTPVVARWRLPCSTTTPTAVCGPVGPAAEAAWRRTGP
jgi:hypothetical protein